MSIRILIIIKFIFLFFQDSKLYFGKFKKESWSQRSLQIVRTFLSLSLSLSLSLRFIDHVDTTGLGTRTRNYNLIFLIDTAPCRWAGISIFTTAVFDLPRRGSDKGNERRTSGWSTEKCSRKRDTATERTK